MGNGVEARLEYGGLLLICDDDAFARLSNLLRTEAAIDGAPGGPDERRDVGYVLVEPRARSEERASGGPGWIELLPCFLLGILNLVVMIVGLVTITQLFIRLFG